MVNFKGKHILSGKQFNREEIEHILKVASDLREELKSRPSLDLTRGNILATLFFEPSTRTRLSFESAMLRLGGSVIGFAEASTSSTAKGESLEDTILTVCQYADVIAMRHPQIGSAERASRVATVPILNGGDGAGQHPTQALLDILTIKTEKGAIDGLTVALVGDLKNGRTVHALVELLKHYQVEMIFVAPQELRMPPEITESLKSFGVKIKETDTLSSALKEADIVYMTRVQKERFSDPSEYEKLKDAFILNRAMVEQGKAGITILHPLPRVTEISTDVDSLPGAAYFRQVRNGLYVRMALIALVLGKI
ncbi:MAG: aspartate carbamoyltransferase [Caldiserica bacterium]|jgi:aspartate carbamoyltransferase|nr:aspartate carbamoyltransferase [Caldisericota bacterium]MDH7562366.1 aspartate carbamoyltransferase [Caldisericota bacterium]